MTKFHIRASISILLLVSCSTFASAAVIAVGNLQSCFNNGTDSLDCAIKIVVTLSIENNRLYETEALNFNVACINSPTGQCPCPCFYADDPTCQCRDLRRVISVGITKSPVNAVYSLSQPRMFNGKPDEVYITTGAGGTGGRSCSDDPFNAEPTCGWAKAPDENGNMQAIPDSQGFCCNCPTPFGGDPIIRGYRSCAWSPNWITGGVPGSAHCLRYDEYWWYRGYVIGPYQLEFDINVNINTTDSAPTPPPASAPSSGSGTGAPPPPPPSSSTSIKESLTINPSRQFILSGQRAVSVRLVGDLAPYRQIQVLDGHWLMIPVQPDLSPNEMFTENLDMWVVLPPQAVTTTGECNKVGVGYTAFKIQNEKCNQPVGSCLRNQIYDFEVEDIARIANGMEPLYNITRYGGGYRNQRQLATVGEGGGLALRLPLKGIGPSLVTLEVRADDLQLVVNRAPGKIKFSQVCTFDKKICGGFTSISGTGFLTVQVENTGTVAADFRAGVLGCSGGVLPVVEEYAAIAPSASYNFTFELRMETDLEGNRNCTVVVTDAAGDIADSTVVNFYTNATQYDPPPDESDLGDKPTNPGDPPNFKKCSKLCPNLFNIKCLIVNWCWKRLIESVATMISIIAGITMLYFAFKFGWITKCIKITGAMLPKNKNKKRGKANASGDDSPSNSGRKRPRNGEEPGQSSDESLSQMYKKKLNTAHPQEGVPVGTFADAAAVALATKHWRHYQQQQQALAAMSPPPVVIPPALNDQLIGAYHDGSPLSLPLPPERIYHSPSNLSPVMQVHSPSASIYPPPSPDYNYYTPSASLLATSPELQGSPMGPMHHGTLTNSPQPRMVMRTQTLQPPRPQQRPSPIQRSVTLNSPPRMPNRVMYSNPLAAQQQEGWAAAAAAAAATGVRTGAMAGARPSPLGSPNRFQGIAMAAMAANAPGAGQTQQLRTSPHPQQVMYTYAASPQQPIMQPMMAPQAATYSTPVAYPHDQTEILEDGNFDIENDTDALAMTVGPMGPGNQFQQQQHVLQQQQEMYYEQQQQQQQQEFDAQQRMQNPGQIMGPQGQMPPEGPY